MESLTRTWSKTTISVAGTEQILLLLAVRDTVEDLLPYQTIRYKRCGGFYFLVLGVFIIVFIFFVPRTTSYLVLYFNNFYTRVRYL